MRSLERWAKGRPEPVRLAAVMFLPRLKQVVEACNLAQVGFGTPAELEAMGVTPESWVRFYRRPTEVADSIIRLAMGVSRKEFKRRFTKAVAGLDQIPDADLAEAWLEGGLDGIAKAAPSLDDAMYDAAQDMIKLQRKAGDPPEDMGPDIEALNMFIMAVQIPCLVAHGEQISKLYRKAYAGSGSEAIEALDGLLRLDKRVIADPYIKNVWFKVSHGGNILLADRMKKAVAGRPRALTPKRMKVFGAAAVWLAADFCKHRLTAPNLRGLFNAMAREFEDTPVDHDLTGSEEALQKAIKREKDRLLEVLGLSHLMPNHAKS